MNLMKKINQLFLMCAMVGVCFLSSCDSDDGGPSLKVADQTLSVAEDIESGESVGTIDAEFDADATIGFEVVSGNEAETFVLSAAGELTLADGVSLDYEEVESYALMVEVTDGTSTEEVTITINVIDVDENGLLLLNGVTYEFGEDGLVFDEGASDPFDANIETHYGYNFQFGEAELTLVEDEGEEDYVFTNVTMLFVTELYVPGVEAFSVGTFEFAEGDATAEDLEGKSFFKELAFVVDGNGNGEVLSNQDDVDKDIVYMATAGSVELTSSEENVYHFDFDLTISEIIFDPEKYLYEGEIVPGTERKVRFAHEVNCILIDNDDVVVVEDPDAE